MAKERLKDWQGRTMGFMETDAGGNKKIFDSSGRLVGRYNRSQNVTTTWQGVKVAQGDCLTMLLKK